VALVVGVLVVVGSSSLAGAKEPYTSSPTPDVRLGFVVFGEQDGSFLAVALCNGATFERGRSQTFRGDTVRVVTDAGSEITARVGKKRLIGSVELPGGQKVRFKARPGWYGAAISERCGGSIAAALSS
jgi:hypothetical protein